MNSLSNDNLERSGLFDDVIAGLLRAYIDNSANWAGSAAEGVVVVSGTTDMYPTTRVPLSTDHRGLTIVSVSGGD